MRAVRWCAVVLLAVLLPCSAGRRQAQVSTSPASPWGLLSSHWSDNAAARSVSPESGQLRALLLEVRQRLRQPDLRNGQRRRLKARKRRLREKLRAERAKRRRQRQRQHRRRHRLHAARQHQLPATVLERPEMQEPELHGEGGSLNEGTTGGSADMDSALSRLDTVGTQQYSNVDDSASENIDRIGEVDSMDIDPPVGNTPTTDTVGQELGATVTDSPAQSTVQVGSAAVAEDSATGESPPEPAADASNGGFLNSLWDWVSSQETAEAEESAPHPDPWLDTASPAAGAWPSSSGEETWSPPEEEWSPPEYGAPHQDAGWTVPPLPNGKRPNIVLIMTDDLDVELGSLKYMPKLRRFLQDEGVTFRHGYVSTPLCCPSRSSYLTGMFIHNHHVYTNRDNCSRALWQNTHEKRTYAAYLQQAGYRTGYFGKYMNRYDGDHIPVGWDHWSSLILNSKYYNYSMNVNGRRIYKGWKYPQDYLPLVIVNDSLSYFETLRRSNSRDPVLLVLSFPSPHGPEDAAPQHTHLFLNVTDHHTPSYDFAPNADKQWFLRYVGKMDAVERTFTDMLMTKRLQTLQSVDDAIETVYRRLAAAGELDSTYILFTSDHGYHLGQFGVAKGKSYPFEFDIRVPFVVRGPGVRAGSRSLSAVLNVDVAPTLLEMGGVARPPQMDGRSFLPLLAATDADDDAPPVPWPPAFIVEGAGKRPDQRQRMRLQQGAVRPDDGAVLYVSALQRLQEACAQPEYHSPCKPYQKWACYHDGRRWRLQKCRRHRRRQQMCACRGGVVQGTRRIHPRERKDQLRFLKHHMNGDVRRMRMRFVKELQDEPPPTVAPSPPAASADSLVKQFVQEEDSSHVDDNIRRIGLELLILQSHVSTMGRCAVDNTTCAVPDLRTRQRTVREQMRHLKRLLRELKNIQRFLSNSAVRRGRWGTGGGRQAGGRGLTFDDSEFEDYRDGDAATEPGESDVAFCPCRPMDDRAERQWVREYTKQARREERAQRRHERRKQKRRRQRKKALLASQNCDFDGLNCFVQDSSHWKTPPLWTQPPVCICVGASNGTFDCVRHVAADENWLYCRFVTGFLSFYDLTVDPYQLHNLAPTLSRERLQAMDAQLVAMLSCSGPDQCRPLPPPPAGAAPLTTVAPSLPPPLLTVSLPPVAPPTAETRASERGERRRRRRREKHRQRHLRRINERARRLEWMRRLQRQRPLEAAEDS